MCHQSLDGHSRSPEDGFFWVCISKFPTSGTMRFTFLALSEKYQPLLNGSSWHLGQTFMVTSGWIVITLVIFELKQLSVSAIRSIFLFVQISALLMAMLVCPHWIIPTAIGWIAMKVCLIIHGPQRISHTYFEIFLVFNKWNHQVSIF